MRCSFECFQLRGLTPRFDFEEIPQNTFSSEDSILNRGLLLFWISKTVIRGLTRLKKRPDLKYVSRRNSGKGTLVKPISKDEKNSNHFLYIFNVDSLWLTTQQVLDLSSNPKLNSVLRHQGITYFFQAMTSTLKLVVTVLPLQLPSLLQIFLRYQLPNDDSQKKLFVYVFQTIDKIITIHETTEVIVLVNFNIHSKQELTWVFRSGSTIESCKEIHCTQWRRVPAVNSNPLGLLLITYPDIIQLILHLHPTCTLLATSSHWFRC